MANLALCVAFQSQGRLRQQPFGIEKVPRQVLLLFSANWTNCRPGLPEGLQFWWGRSLSISQSNDRFRGRLLP